MRFHFSHRCACVDATLDNGIETRTVTGLTIGNTYYICVHDWYAGGGDFTICVTTPAAPPANDNCAGAVSLTPSSSCVPTTGNVASASQSIAGCTGTANDDVWYSFVATATQHTVTVDGSTSFDAVVQIYSVSCGGTSLGCIDATLADQVETTTLAGLTIGNTYWVRVYDYYGGTPATTTFTICITAPGPPQCANYTGPADGAEFCGTSTTLTWTAPSTGSAPTGYLLYYGTNNPPTNIVNGTNLGNVLSYAAGGLVTGTTYYWQIVPTNGMGNATNCALQSFNVIPCVSMSNGSSTTCNAAFYDSGGPSGSASDNSNLVYTFCPSIAGQCVQSNFYNFGTETNFDFLYVYDGNSTAAPQLPGSPFTGNLAPFSIIGSTSNATGCLTFQFISDGSTPSSGWDASITCAPCGSVSFSAQDCQGSIFICNDQSFGGNSLGQGVVNDLNGTNMGCLTAEHQTSWYYFSPATSGTIQLAITPANGIDDYDFAIWGPLGGLTCPPATAPFRCSYSALDGITGLNLTATDVSEGVGGDKWVDELTVVAGQVYVMCIDNYSTSSQPFTLDWTLTNGATLNCTPLSAELVTLTGEQKNKTIELNWITASETDNNYFTIEKSIDGINFSVMSVIDGAGTSNIEHAYFLVDEKPVMGINYYRLKQTDFNGLTKISGIVGVDFKNLEMTIENIHPNPTNENISWDFYSPINGIIHVQILDYTGRVVLDEKQSINEGKNTLSTKMNTLSVGIYSLRVSHEQAGFNFNTKIIKQ